MKVLENLPKINDRFGKLTVIAEPIKVKYNYTVKCACDCGKVTTPKVYNLLRGFTKGCGTCYKKEKPPRVKLPRAKHEKRGLFRSEFNDHPLYSTYKSMVSRCIYPSNPNYDKYGGRGIKVCDRWMEPNGQGFLNFVMDMGPKPTPKHSIDRLDGKKGYSPGNCRWATSKEQIQNREVTTNATTGTVFGDFTVIEELAQVYVDKYNQNRRVVKVKCTCGNTLIRKLNDLRPKRSTKCLCNSNRVRKSDEYDLTDKLNQIEATKQETPERKGFLDILFGLFK